MAFLSTLKSRLWRMSSAGLALFSILIAAPGVRAATLPVDGYNPSPNNTVTAMALQPDGKLVIGGYFSALSPEGAGGVGAASLARINHDGSVDTTFTPGTNGIIRAMLLQPNGQILISGTFTTVTGTGGTATPRNYFARLNADGTLDTTFNPNPNAVVYAIALQPNGQILIGGVFTALQPNGAAATTARNHVARLNSDGTLDGSFSPGTDKTVLALAVQGNGQIVIGGGFSQLTGTGASAATTRNFIGRVNSDGSVDTGYDPEPNGSVMCLLVEPSGQVVMGGEFVTVQPNGASSTSQVDFLARLNSDGTLDSSFIINPLEYVTALALQPDGKLIIGGVFTQVYPYDALSSSAITYVARINPNGTVDSTWVPQPNQEVNAIAVQPDGNIILGGYFTSLSPVDTSSTLTRNYLARVNNTGVPDNTLAPDQIGTVLTTAQLANGQVLVGGTFLSIGGASQNYLGRLNADGSLDTTFAPILNGPVQSIAVASDGTYVVGGSFSEVDGFNRNYITRLNPDGTIVGSFNPNPNGAVEYIYPLANGQFLISGGFSYLTPNGSTTAIGIDEFARINNDGSLDITFNPAPNGGVFAIAPQANGSLVLGGGFTSINGHTRSYLARIHPDGTADGTNFDPEANSSVYAIVVQSDGKIVVGGAFTELEPQTSTAQSITNPDTTTITQPNGNVLTIPPAGVSAIVPIPVNHMARLNPDGTLDTSFFPDPNLDVLSMQLLTNGQIVVGGLFTSFAQNGATTGLTARYMARVNPDGSLDTSFEPNFNNLVNTIATTAAGGYLAGGSFTTLQPNGAAAPIQASHVAVLTSGGGDVTTFVAGQNGNAGGAAEALAVLPNGQLIVGGAFTTGLGGNPASYVNLFNPDSTANVTYNADVNGPVHAVGVEPNGAATQTPSNAAVWLEPNGSVRYTYSAATDGEVACSVQLANGQVLVGGLFTSFNGHSGLQNLVLINTDGTVDTNFNPTPNGLVNSIAIQTNGQIIIGGDFTAVAGTTVNYCARLNADGTLDTTFNPNPSAQVLAVAVQADGKVLLGGDFSYLQPNGATSATTIYYLARVTSTGALDTAFNPDPNNPVYCILPLASGDILIGGDFTQFTPNFGSTTDTILYLARLNSNGTPDLTYEPDPNGPVSAIVQQPADSKVIIGGSFTSFTEAYNPSDTTQPNPTVTLYYIARLNTDGSVDKTFDPNPNSAVTVVQLQADGSVVFGGAFSAIEPNGTGLSANRYDIARVFADGTLDPSFDPGLNGTVNTVSILSDGSLFVGGDFNAISVGGALLIGGSFSSIQGFSAPNLGRLNADGSFDSSYLAHPDGPVYALAPQADNKFLVGGSFAHIEGLAETNLARINIDGTVDATFAAAANGAVYTLEPYQNGQILVGGAFTTMNGAAATSLARLTLSGGMDPTFTPAINGAVNAALLQPNGQILIGGAFTTVDGSPENHLARLNANGTLDPSFVASADGIVQGLSLQADGTLYAVGAFQNINGTSVPYAAHLGPTGAVDATFQPNPNGPVNAVAVQADGKVILAGGFNGAAGYERLDLARFPAPSPVTQTVGASGDESTLTWTRTGNTPVFSSVFFEESTDDNTWTTVGNGTSTDGETWTISGLASTGASTYFVRATGTVPTTQHSSNGLFQVVAMENAAYTSSVTSSKAVTATVGSPFLFAITATNAPLGYSATGLPPGLTINPTSGVISGTPTTAGTYTVDVSVTNAEGTAVSAMTITIGTGTTTAFVPAATSPANRLFNLSSRTDLTGSETLIAGFVISGTGSKQVILRAVGPGLTNYGVTNVLVTPELQVYNAAGTMLYENSTWGGSSALIAAFQAVGAFALLPGSADAALEESLPPGAYTMKVFDPNNNGGVVLAEVYDADAGAASSPTRLVNLSARGGVSSGDGALIGGFVITGSSTKSVLIRGVGPGLAAFGVTDAIPDPVLSVYNAAGTLIAQNLAWTNQTSISTYQPAIAASDITAMDALVGAFALAVTNNDTAVICNLPAGAYTFEITSASNTTGEALGEVYELP